MGGAQGVLSASQVVEAKGSQNMVVAQRNSFPLSNPKEFRINGIFAVYKLGDLRDTGT